MNNDELARALERCEQNKISNEARLAKAKARAELVRCFHEKWSVIFADEPTEPKDFDNWLDQYNDRIEQFLDAVKKSRLAEFLPAIQSNNDCQFICVSLLNQAAAERRASLKRLLEGLLNTWQQLFQNTLLVDRLLGWEIWRDALTLEERYRLYQTNCLETQNLGYDERHKENAFRHCRTQWELLENDPNWLNNENLIRLDYDKSKPSSRDTDEANSSNKQQTVLLEDCKNEILVHWFLNRLPQSVKIWHDNGCPLIQIPETQDDRFKELIQEFKSLSMLVKRDTQSNKSKRKRRKSNSKELTGKQELLAGGLRTWHEFDPDSMSVRNLQPCSYRDLEKLTKVPKGKTMSNFFDECFGGNEAYKKLCKDQKSLAYALAKLSLEGSNAMLSLSEKMISKLMEKN
ncbi:hypothetical protein N9Z53_04615 [Mariniblastus sp.]|nr:hypothetical protein [Mariniblastus sp.]